MAQFYVVILGFTLEAKLVSSKDLTQCSDFFLFSFFFLETDDFDLDPIL